MVLTGLAVLVLLGTLALTARCWRTVRDLLLVVPAAARAWLLCLRLSSPGGTSVEVSVSPMTSATTASSAACCSLPLRAGFTASIILRVFSRAAIIVAFLASGRALKAVLPP